jgi:hypothetical protein
MTNADPVPLVGVRAGPNPRRVYLYLIGYLVVLHALPFFNMLLGGAIPVFVVVNAVAAYSGWLVVRYLHARAVLRPMLTPLDLAITGYFLLSAASFLLFFQDEHPVPASAFAYGVHYLVVPIALFFTAKGIDADKRVNVIRWICGLNVWLIAVGVILYVTQPAFFSDFLIRYYSASSQVPGEIHSRMTSYFGSTAVGMVAAVTIALVPAARYGPLVTGLIVALMVAGAALSQQRGAFIATMLALVYYLFATRVKMRWKLVSVLVGGAVLISVAVWVNAKYAGILDLLIHRLVTINEALAERASAYAAAGSYFSDFPFGAGVGTTVSAAGRTALNLRGEITDANFARIFADLGPAGLLLFVAVIVLAVHRAFRLRGGLGWVVLLAIYCIVAVGMNVFDTYYVGHLFWLLLGLVDSMPLPAVAARRAVAPIPPALVAGRT